MKTQISAVETATQNIKPSGVNSTSRPTPNLMVKASLPTSVPSVANTTRPVTKAKTPLMMPSRKPKVSFTPPHYEATHKVNNPENTTKHVIRFKRGEVDDLAYLQNDMNFLTTLARGDNNPQLVRLERSAHFRERQFERGIRTAEIFDILNKPKVFSYQKERVWKVEGQNGISILLAFSGTTTTGKQILLGITVYSEDSPSTLTYKQWSQNLSNSKKLTKKSKKYHQDSSL